MAGGIDTSKRKPRKAWGTPAYKIRNYVGLVGTSIGAIIGITFYLLTSDKTRLKWDKLLASTEEEVERKLRMSILTLTPADLVRQAIEEEKDS